MASTRNPNTRAPRTRLGRAIFAPRTGPDALHLGDILRNETTGGFLMLAATVAALLWANLDPSSYQQLSHWQLGPLSVAHWASDGLLTIFFFIAGLELKRELVEGSLSRPADAMVPIVAAVAGMAVPAGIYLLVNQLAGGQLSGWAIPMATDIAFALAVLAVVGRHLPAAVRAFLLTLAIVDDLGAILVIAFVYTGGVQLWWLLAAMAAMALWWLGHRNRWRLGPLYWLIFLAAWYAMLRSGVHATIAGVALGLLTAIDKDELDDPADRWQRAVQPWSAGLVVPLFALFAAGVPLDRQTLTSLWTNPVPLGIILALVLGKSIGVFGGAWLTAHLTSAELGDGVRWRDVFAVAQVAGIGFTVSILITELTFTDASQLAQAKAAVLVASLIAAIFGGLALARRSRRHHQHDQPADH